MRKRTLIICIIAIISLLILGAITALIMETTPEKLINNPTGRIVVLPCLSSHRFGLRTFVAISDDNGVRLVIFSENRTAVRTDGLGLVERKDLDSYLLMRMDVLIDSYGLPHADTGSGFSIPSYLTKDGYLLRFWEDNGVIGMVSQTDLFTGEEVIRQIDK